MVRVQCPKCNRLGSLTTKQTKSKGHTYEYWYVEHHIEDKIKWCYLGKYEKLPEHFKKLIHKDTQNYTQTSTNSEKPKSSSFYRNSSKYHEPRWPSWLGHRLGKAEVAGSNPARGFTEPSFLKEAHKLLFNDLFNFSAIPFFLFLLLRKMPEGLTTISFTMLSPRAYISYVLIKPLFPITTY